MNMNIRQEVLYADVTELKMSPYEKAESKIGDRKLPIFTTLKVTEEDYKDFWAWTNHWSERWMSFINDDIFGYGVPLPY